MAETNARLSENKSNPSNGVLTLDFESGRRTAAVQDAGASHCAWKFAKLLECACLFWRFLFRCRITSLGQSRLVFRAVLDPFIPAQSKAAEGQPQSKTLARVAGMRNLRSLQSPFVPQIKPSVPICSLSWGCVYQNCVMSSNRE